MKNRRRSLAIALALSLAIGLLAACQPTTTTTVGAPTGDVTQTESTPAATDPAATDPVASDPADTTSGTSADTTEPAESTSSGDDETPQGEPFVMSAMLTTWGGIAGEKPVHQAWLARMGELMGRPVTVDINYVPSAEYDEKANLAINSRNMADYMVTPFLYDYNRIGEQGLIIDLAEYRERMPNYFDRVAQSHDGLLRVSNDAGQVFALWEVGLPRLPADRGLVAANLTAFRSDILSAEGLEVPETQEAFFETAQRLKELYPDTYPVNTQFQSLNALFFANHVTNDVFWDGEDYQYGPLTEGYADAIRFARRLFEAELLDPEYLSESVDTIKEKALNDKNFLWLTMWFTTPGELSRNSNWEKVYTVSLTPANDKYGVPYENRSATNEVELSNWSAAVLNAEYEDKESLIDFVDLQFSDEIIRLITWGIEGESYTVDEQGEPHFVDAIRNAEDPWLAGDEWGMRMSRNYRPGLQSAADSKAYTDAAPDDSVYYKGEIQRVPVEQAFLDIPYPDSPQTPPWFNGPTLQFTTEEAEELNTIMSAVNTLRDELQAYLISGDEPLEKLDNIADELAAMGDIERALEIHRAAKARYDARGN